MALPSHNLVVNWLLRIITLLDINELVIVNIKLFQSNYDVISPVSHNSDARHILFQLNDNYDFGDQRGLFQYILEFNLFQGNSKENTKAPHCWSFV